MIKYTTPSVRVLEVGLMSMIATSGFTAPTISGSVGEPGTIGDIIDGGDF